ncbi:hypothetical protein BY458DRAFT_487983 [Sporodiniella umbellata]|nr:hypothetical protein BY458DRAFT_487983 [Sporodiniella umbellata]
MTSQVVLDQIRELEQFIDVWETPESTPSNQTEIHKPDDGTEGNVPEIAKDKPNEIAQQDPVRDLQSTPEEIINPTQNKTDNISESQSKPNTLSRETSDQNLAEDIKIKELTAEKYPTEKVLQEIKPEEKTEANVQEKSEEKTEDVAEEKIEQNIEAKMEKQSAEKPEEIVEEKPEEKPEEKSNKIFEEKPEQKVTDQSKKKPGEKLGEKPEERIEEKPEEKTEESVGGSIGEKPEENLGEKPEEKSQENLGEKPEGKSNKKETEGTQVTEENKQDTNERRIQRKAIPDNYKIRSKDDTAQIEASYSLHSLNSTQNLANDSSNFHVKSINSANTTNKEKLDYEGITEAAEKSFLCEQPPAKPTVQSRTTSISSRKSSRSAKSTRRQNEKSKLETSQKYIERSYEEMMRIPDIFERIAFYEKTLELCLKSDSPISDWSQFMSVRGKPPGLEEGYTPLPRSESDLDSFSQGSVSTTFSESISFFLKKAAGSQAFNKRPIENKSFLIQNQNKNGYGSGVFGRSISRLNLSRSTQISKYDQPKILGHRVNALSKRSPCSIRNTTRVTNIGSVKASISTPQSFRKGEDKEVSPELTYMLSILPHEEINTLLDALKEANGDTTDAISIVMNKKHSVFTQ